MSFCEDFEICLLMSGYCCSVMWLIMMCIVLCRYWGALGGCFLVFCFLIFRFVDMAQLHIPQNNSDV